MSVQRQHKPGRPPTGRPTGRKVTLYMLPDVEERAKAIGAGVLSAGVAAAVRAYRPRSRRTPDTR